MQFLFMPNFWKKKCFVAYCFLPLSFIYKIIALIIAKITKPYNSKIKTICIGNAIIGGSGKTPTSISIGQYLSNKGKKCCFITRGYGGSFKGPILVDNSCHKAQEVGDEPLILAKYLPTIVSKNKISGIKYAEKQGFECAIFDDGLQNPSLNYDLKILLDQKSENNFLIPAGPFREDREIAIKKADFVLTKEYSTNLPNKFLKFETIAANEIPNDKLINFAGTANPEEFFKLVRSFNNNIVLNIPFPDHYHYQEIDIKNLIDLAHKKNAILLTTEKDYVKIPQKYKSYIKVLNIVNKVYNLNKIYKKLYEKN